VALVEVVVKVESEPFSTPDSDSRWRSVDVVVEVVREERRDLRTVLKRGLVRQGNLLFFGLYGFFWIYIFSILWHFLRHIRVITLKVNRKVSPLP
jgi:hypothetical protein